MCTPRRIRCSFTSIAAAAVFVADLHAEAPPPNATGMLKRYDVVWNSPSRDASGSMPLGNGDIGLNAWVEENGDLLFYIGKTDAWGDNARLLKVGKVRIRLDPAPFGHSELFQQTLSLRDATMVVRCGQGDEAVTVQLWVDANHPVIHVTADSKRPLTATASIELWRTQRHELPSIEVSDVLLNRSRPNHQHAPTIVEPDTVLKSQAGRIGWYHHNTKSVGPALTAEIQGLSAFERPDPLLHRTFGAVILAENGRRVDDLNLFSPRATTHRINIYVLTRHPASPPQWLAAMDQIIAATEERPFSEQRAAHEAWWRQFWERSWIHVASSDLPPKPAFIPVNSHPVRIGVDQQGGNRFIGELARVSVSNKAVRDEQVRRLAQLGRDRVNQPGDGLLYTGLPEAPFTVDGSKDWDFADGLTVEAWVNPRSLPPGGGRIVDKITPGKNDGFLFDTYPGNSLRLITAAGTLLKKEVLPEGRWVHVAAVVDPSDGDVKLYLNGEPVAAEQQEFLDDAFVVSRGYALQRFVDACAGRGWYPIKFNGSIFTVPYPDRPGDADYRRWGPGYWWQNTRLPYLSLCTSGDFDLMQPLFQMYAGDVMPLCRYRTRLYCGHDGAFIPECIYFWGDIFSETYGWTPFDQRDADKLQSSRWHKWEWVSGLELVWMMLDYYEHTREEAFLNDTLLPTAHDILTFFDQHYAVGGDGKLVMHPAQAVETWWECTNPMPELAGLHAVTGCLLSLPPPLTTEEQRSFWRALRGKLPDLPTREVEGTRMLAPAEEFADKRNVENPELYAVFPFRLVSYEKPNAELGIEALKQRWDKGNFGWRQDDVFMAYLGLTDEVREYLVGRARNTHTGSRFPAFWGPNYDWVPDQDHGGVLMKALQAMLMQTDGEKIFLLPAWPADWNVSFRLHAPHRTVVECEYRGGEVRSLKVAPKRRAGDIVPGPGVDISYAARQ